jgi:hypothetical protein
MTSWRKIGTMALAVLWAALCLENSKGLAAAPKAKPRLPKAEADDPDKPPPLELGPGDDSPGESAPANPGRSVPARPAVRRSNDSDPNRPDYESNQPSRFDQDRDKVTESVRTKLAAVKTTGKKTDKDFFAISTIQLIQRRAMVDYFASQGEAETVTKVVEFLLSSPKDAPRRWWVHGRVKTRAAAENLLKTAKTKESIEGKLTAYPLKSGKRTPEDSFVIGTAEIFKQHADVRFQVLRGIKEAANFIMEFILKDTATVDRKFEVFGRARTQEDAEKLVQQLRNDYDNLEQQRLAIAQAYQVATTRRC